MSLDCSEARDLRSLVDKKNEFDLDMIIFLNHVRNCSNRVSKTCVGGLCLKKCCWKSNIF